MTGASRAIQSSRFREAAPSVVLGALVVALALVFWPYGLDQFDLPKQLTLMVGVPVVAGVFLFCRGQGRRSETAPDIDKPLVTLVVFLTVWSVLAPLWHTQNRALHLMGAGEALLLAALFAVSLLVRRESGPQALSWLTVLLAVPPVVVAGIALAQAWGIDPLRIFLDLSSSRPGRWQTLTTLGNPTWTAEWIAVSFPFVMVALGFGRERSPAVRWTLILAALLLTAGVAVTGSRGGLVGLGIGASALWLLGRSSNALAAGLVGLCLLAFGAVCSWTAGAARWGDAEPITGRLALWAAGAHGLREAPFTGQGLGHTALVLPNGLKWVAAEVEPGRHSWLPTMLVDRLDNDWLQVALERGSLAGLLLFAVWLRAVWLAGRRSLDGGSRVEAVVAASLLVFGFLASVSAPLHTPATAALFFVLVGLAAHGDVGLQSHAEGLCRRRWPWFVSAALCGVVAAIAGGVACRVHEANSQAGECHRLLLAGQFRRAADCLRAPLQTMPWLTAASIDRARALIDSGQAAEALVVVDDGKRWAGSGWFWAAEAQALHQLGLDDQAHKTLDEAFKVLPRSPVLLEAREHLSSPRSAEKGR